MQENPPKSSWILFGFGIVLSLIQSYCLLVTEPNFEEFFSFYNLLDVYIGKVYSARILEILEFQTI